MNVRVGIFELRDGVTPARAQRFAATLAQIDYPWRRLLPHLRGDPDGSVVVRWAKLPQGTTGQYHGTTTEVHLIESSTTWVETSEPFVIAHEIGHLVDSATLKLPDRNALTDLMHRDPPVQIGHFNHDHPDAGHSIERWRANETYVSRINEAYADLFVAAFAPALWPGWHRFVHHTDDVQEVRRLTLARSIQVFTDVPEGHTHREGIERAAELGLVGGYPDGTFRPDSPITRAQAATIAVRQYDKILSEVTDGEL